MNTKRILLLALALLLCFSCLTGCETNDNEKTANETEAFITVGDEVLSVAQFRFYILREAFTKAYSFDSAADMATFDWEQKTESGATFAEAVIDSALQSAINDTILVAKAKENGFSLSDEEKKNIDQTVKDYISQNGEEKLMLAINGMALESIEDYKSLQYREQLKEQATTMITENIDDYIDKDVDLAKWKSNDKVRVQHVLIKNDSQTYPDPEATAKEVLKQAKEGVDFTTLIEKYNEDPGATATGYTFGRGEMVPEFETASYALECGEISDIVKTDYGYHVIRRLPGLYELVNYWGENTKYTVNKKYLDNISVKDIVQDAVKAQNELQG